MKGCFPLPLALGITNPAVLSAPSRVMLSGLCIRLQENREIETSRGFIVDRAVQVKIVVAISIIGNLPTDLIKVFMLF